MLKKVIMEMISTKEKTKPEKMLGTLKIPKRIVLKKKRMRLVPYEENKDSKMTKGGPMG